MQDRAAELVERVLKPLIEADGGTIELVEVSGKQVVIRLSGACAGCPGMPYTLAHVVEPAVRHALGKDFKVVMR